jgi:hypothetical protein
MSSIILQDEIEKIGMHQTFLVILLTSNQARDQCHLFVFVFMFLDVLVVQSFVLRANTIETCDASIGNK